MQLFTTFNSRITAALSALVLSFVLIGGTVSVPAQADAGSGAAYVVELA